MKALSKTLLLLAGMSLLLAGCQKEGPFGGGKNAVRFTASAGSANTKTTYGEYDEPKHPTFQRLDWVVGDRIRVWSPQALDRYHEAEGKHFADYKVSEILAPDGPNSRARIVNALDAVADPAAPENDHANGLLWGDPDTYDFYAVYPSPEADGMPAGVAFEPVGDPAVMTFTGVIPAEQQGSLNPYTDNLEAVAYDPDMRYAYMTAPKASVTTTVAGGLGLADDAVKLYFYPKFTVFEFTVWTGDFPSVTLNSMTLTATTGNLTGTYVIAEDDFGTVATGIADADVTGGGQTVTVTFGESGITFQKNRPVSLSVITLPQTVSGLTVTFAGVEIGTRSLELKDNGVPMEFAPYLKHRIRHLRFPAMMDVVIVDPIIWDGEYWSEAIIGNGTTNDNINWNGDYTGDATLPVDNINWTSDPDVVGPFGGWYLTKGYLAGATDGYALTGDDQMEIIKYHGEGSAQHYFPWTADLAAATVAGYDATGYAVPTQAQWADILGTGRTGAAVNSLAGKHFAKVEVDLTGTEYESYGVDKTLPPVGEEDPVTIKVMNGLLLFPDGAELFIQELLSLDPDAILDNPDDTFSLALTYARLQKLCGGAKGCAFLPCAGYYGSDWTGAGTAGNYWSATGTAAHVATVQPDAADPAANRNPVRLVKALN